jgi:hypothetical protein
VSSDRPAWYLPVGECLDQARAELLAETFRDDAVRVGRGLVARMEARRPGVEVKRSLSSPEQLATNHARPRFAREPVIYLGIAWYDDPNRKGVCGVVLEWETGTVRTTGEPG